MGAYKSTNIGFILTFIWLANMCNCFTGTPVSQASTSHITTLEGGRTLDGLLVSTESVITILSTHKNTDQNTSSQSSTTVHSSVVSRHVSSEQPSVAQSATTIHLDTKTTSTPETTIQLQTSGHASSTDKPLGTPSIEKKKTSRLTKGELAAIISGCLLCLLTVVLFLVIAFIIKHVKVTKEPPTGPVQLLAGRSGDAILYAGLQPQSTEQLVGSMSQQSFMSVPSDLDLHLRLRDVNTHVNKGFELNQESIENLAALAEYHEKLAANKLRGKKSGPN